MRRACVLGVVVLMLAGACADGTTDGGGGTAGGAQERVVQVDGSPDDFQGFALAYFPNEVTVRPGDTVRFEQHFTGEPHSVTMGTIVDDLVPRAVELFSSEEEPPEEFIQELDSSLPAMLPEGPGDAHQAAVNPCFLEAGESLPEGAETPCPEREQPAFTGEQPYYSSGFLPSGEDFVVELSEDVEPGTYSYYCNLHGPEMSGTIEVAAADAEIPSTEDVEAARDAQLEEAFSPLAAAWNEIEGGETPFGNAAGWGCEECGSTGAVEFVPETIETGVGEKVTWAVIGPHTISFNSPVAYALVEADDGTWHLSEEAMAPAGGAGQPQEPPSDPAELGDEERPVAPPEGPPQPTEIDGGSWDGEGFRSSGFVFSFPEPDSFFSYSLTFTEAGTYRYTCLVHPAMTGTVEVS